MTFPMTTTPRTLQVSLLLSVLAGSAPLAGRADTSAGDPVHGKVIFQASCAVCHATGGERLVTAGQGPVLGESWAGRPPPSRALLIRRRCAPRT